MSNTQSKSSLERHKETRQNLKKKQVNGSQERDIQGLSDKWTIRQKFSYDSMFQESLRTSAENWAYKKRKENENSTPEKQ